MKKDIIMLITGAIIGFLLSILTMQYQQLIERRRALKIFEIELYEISKLLPALTSPKQIKLANNEIVNFDGISSTEIPNFKMCTQIDIFLSLKDSLRKAVYEINFDLDQAEKNRVIAFPLLEQPNKKNELDMYASIYLSYLKSAENKIEILKKELK